PRDQFEHPGRRFGPEIECRALGSGAHHGGCLAAHDPRDRDAGFRRSAARERLVSPVVLTSAPTWMHTKLRVLLARWRYREHRVTCALRCCDSKVRPSDSRSVLPLGTGV